jgi:phage host-nuclease inhibitor protein Gam
MKNDVRKITRKLRCVMTGEELLEAGRQLAEATNLLTELDSEKAEIVAEFKAKISAAEAQIAVLSNKLRSGYEFRDVACKVAYGVPEPGFKQTTRLDTGEIIESLPLTEEEKQREMVLES